MRKSQQLPRSFLKQSSFSVIHTYSPLLLLSGALDKVAHYMLCLISHYSPLSTFMVVIIDILLAIMVALKWWCSCSKGLQDPETEKEGESRGHAGRQEGRKAGRQGGRSRQKQERE